MRIRKNLYILGATLPLLLGIYFLYNLYNQIEEKAIDQLIKQEEIYAKQAVRGIESFFTDCKFALDYLATSDPIMNSNHEMPKLLKSFYQSYDKVISGITRIDSSGILLYTYPYNKNSIGKNVLGQEHNKKIKRLHKPIISDVFQSVQGFTTLVYAYPVFKNGKYNGCVSLLIPFNYIAKKFLENIKIGKTGTAFVLSSSGIELYSSSKARIGHSIFEVFSNDSSVIEMAKKMLKGDYGYYKYVYRSEEDESIVVKHAFYYPVKLEDTFWAIGVTAPEQEVLAINKEFQKNFILILTISFVTFFGFIIVYYRSKSNAEKKLKWGEEKYKLVTEQTGQIIYEHNIEKGEFDWAGAIENVTGYSKTEFQNFDVGKFVKNIHKEDREMIKEKSAASIKLKSDFNVEYRFKHKSGEFIYLEDHGAIVLSKDGRIRVGTIKDITERKLTEIKLKENKEKLEKLVEDRTSELKRTNELLKEDLKIRKKTEEELKIAKLNAEKSDKLKSEFLAQMSHEIRTPINTILSFSSLIKEELSGKLDDDLSMSFSGMGSAGKRIIRTIDLILNMSELQTGSYDYKPKEINLYKNVLESLMIEYSSISKEKGLEFRLIKEEKDVFIFADEYTLNQMFANLIDNAIKYTLEGAVTITCKKNGGNKYCVEVSDTGIGISSEYIPYLFDSFTQEDQGYTRKFEGNGLGLALVKEYCDMNKAKIEVESTKGVGTTFRVVFNNLS